MFQIRFPINGRPAETVKNLLHISHNDEPWHNYTLPMEDPKNIKNHVTALNSAEIRIYLIELGNFCYIKKQRKIAFLLILLIFIEFLKVAGINMTAILIMSAKFANPGILKIKGFLK